MRGTKKTIYEWFLVVEGSGEFPIDMLRYDTAFPFDELDSNMIGRHGKRRIMLVRRGVNLDAGTPKRWESFGWKLLHVTQDSYEARQYRDAYTNPSVDT